MYVQTCYKRFLRGRKYIVPDAVNAMLSFSVWRKLNNADNVSAADCQTIMDKKIAFREGHDKYGRPLVSCLAGRHDKNNRDIAEMKNCFIYLMEETVRRADPEEESFCIIFDMSAFSMRCMDYEAVRLLVDILQLNYPDTLGKALVVNAPFIFSACWAIIKMWLDPVTAAKVEFIKAAQLPEYVDPEFIIPEIGDKSICPL
jgi:hypothetical protein